MNINTPTGLAGLTTNYSYMRPPHIELIENELLDIALGRNNRLIITLPPRHGKSEIVSRYFPAWHLLNFPNKRIIFISYQGDFAHQWSKKAMTTFQRIGKYELETERLDFWKLRGYEGYMSATGIDGAITGKGAEVLIIDDPIKGAEEALSASHRNKISDFYNTEAYTRLEPNGSIIIIQTRWHKDDLVGRVLENEQENFRTINIPAIALENDILGRQPGEALWSARFDLDKLNKIKRQLGGYWFSSLYQQTPIASEYQIFKPDWWQYYDERPYCQYVVQTWDTGFKSNEANSYSVCTTWGVSNNNFYLLDMYRGKPIYPDLLRQFLVEYQKWKPAVVLIEDAASGQSLIQDVKTNTKIPIRPIRPTNKELRAHLVTPLLENSRVYIPSLASWLPEFINEHSEFPYGAFNDIVDSTTISLQFFQTSGMAYKNVKKKNAPKEKNNSSISDRFKGY